MANRRDPDIVDDFSELYKEYTGPPVSNATNVQDQAKTNKRSLVNSDDDEEPRDPDAIPTDFTSREAKLWEAKAKATERNWKKKKEEEMICKICGESGHFTQGCPSTLGANRKSRDFFERVPAREKRVKTLFTEKVIQRIERDIGCKIKVEEKFIIVSGRDRLILAKGVDAVHKVKEEGESKGSNDSHMSRSRSPERRSPLRSRFGHTGYQRSLPSPHQPSQVQHRFSRQDKVVEDLVREDLQKLARSSPQAYGNGARSRSSHSKSPAHPLYTGNSHNSYENHNQRWDTQRPGSHMLSGRNFDYPHTPQTLEELELECKREAMELERIRDKEEHEEKYKHREAVKETRENYMKRLAILRGTHAKHREEFLQLDGQRRQQRAHQEISTSGFGGYGQPHPCYAECDNSVGNAHYTGAATNNIRIDLRGRYPNPMDNYASTRPRDALQCQRHENYGKAYNRF